MGWKGFRRRIPRLPQTAEATIEAAVEALGIGKEEMEDFLHKQLFSIRGWAGSVQFRVREMSMRGRDDDSLFQLLAIRLAYDLILFEVGDCPVLSKPLPGGSGKTGDVFVSLIWQMAQENAWQRKLLGKLKTPLSKTARNVTGRKAVQTVFCIDVRSEIFRRALETTGPDLETIGFAGFFGLPIEHVPLGREEGSSKCPVLLTPSFRVREKLIDASPREEAKVLSRINLAGRARNSWSSFKTSAISSFCFVETAGLAFGPKLIREAFFPGKAPASRICSGPSVDQIPLEGRLQLALGALRNMGLTRNFARLVLLCGHGSETKNNPYGSGLDCGACGGHAGDANARVGAAILNDPDVRRLLADQGIEIPTDTWFVAGLHVTTTDEVNLFDLDTIPESHQSEAALLQSRLAEAGSLARRERAASLGLPPESESIDSKVRARSCDWSEVRPEWGLAGNAAFIAAPRERTREIGLDGRVFLHNYDHEADVEKSTLELIMIAPMVVANWINLQYYGSTVNNSELGSGNKVIHNVVGTDAVCGGNDGDLLTGLPLQSVWDGARWVHEPLRLHVFIEAPRNSIEEVLRKHESVRQLVDGGWLLLFAMEDRGDTFHRYLPGLGWEAI